MNYAPNSTVRSEAGDVYTIVRQLGNGANGSVYMATINNIPLALKFIPFNNPTYQIELSVGQILRERLPDDKKSLVCLLNCYFQTETHAVLGYPLLCPDIYENRLSKMELFTLKEVQSALKCVTTALKCFNEFGIVHADIKPENIVQYTYDHFVIIDFGNCVPENFREYENAFTLYYRPPEAIFGLELTTESDIWALACTAVEMLHGNPLFVVANVIDLIDVISSVVGPMPQRMIDETIRAELFDETYVSPYIYQTEPLDTILEEFGDSDFTDLIKKMLALDPTERLTPEEILEHPFLTKKIP